MRIAQIARDLLGCHHGGAALGERGLLRRRGLERGQFFHRMAQPIGLALGTLDLGALGGERGFASAPLVPQPRHLLCVRLDPAECIEQGAMRGGIHQRTFVVLAVDLDQRGAERLQDLRTHRLVVGEGAGAAIRELHAPKDQFVRRRDAVLGHERMRRMRARQIEGRRHLSFAGAVAHQRHIATRAERECKGIEQDRLAGAGLAGQHRQTRREVDVEPIDQDDVADGQPGEHDNNDDDRERKRKISAILSSVVRLTAPVPRTRSSRASAASPIANFGFKGALES